MNMKEKKAMRNWAKINKVYRMTLAELHPVREAEVRVRVIESFSALPDRRTAAKALGNTVAEWLIIKTLEV